MLMSAGIELPRKVWVHGWLLAAGGERMSKSRGNMLDATDVVAALGTDGTRYVVLREVPFDRDAEVSWDSFVRRYNADLANDFGNLVNRTVSMTNRYLAGERPSIAAPDGRLGGAWHTALGIYEARFRAYLLHDALGALWEFVGAANRFVDAEQPWTIAKAAKAGDEQALVRLRGILGDLVEACRLVALAAAPFIPNTAPLVLAQLGYRYEYALDGNGGPPLVDELRWGAHAAEPGRLAVAEPLFPRLETEVAASASA
jgi:methionyl-tRNA synthetase